MLSLLNDVVKILEYALLADLNLCSIWLERDDEVNNLLLSLLVSTSDDAVDLAIKTSACDDMVALLHLVALFTQLLLLLLLRTDHDESAAQ